MGVNSVKWVCKLGEPERAQKDFIKRMKGKSEG